MIQNINQNLIDEVLELSKDSDIELQNMIKKLVVLYNDEKEQCKIALAEEAKKEKLLEQQSKMATMGEMMDAVAHQWKQPLNAISMMADMIQDDFNDGLVDKKYIDDLSQTSRTQIEHMINTLNEFRTFFRPSKRKIEKFLFQNVLDSVSILLKDKLISHHVNIDLDIEDNLYIMGIENEFKHLLLNLIINSIDAFEDNNIKDKHIYIRAFHKDDEVIIEFEDNAGGILESVISDIFKPNITTKTDGKGTGIGLYISSQIINKCNGTISVKNSKNGALFTINIK